MTNKIFFDRKTNNYQQQPFKCQENSTQNHAKMSNMAII